MRLGTASNPCDSSSHPQAEVVRAELERVLASPAFVRAGRMRAFLRLIVEKALEGGAGRLRETQIGTAVYGRQPGYDPKVEPIVRTEARRLRAKLDQYYSACGADSTVHISLPVGGYSPAFHFRSAPAATPRRRPEVWKRRIAAIALVAAIVAPVLWFRKSSAGLDNTPVAVTAYDGLEFQPAVSTDGARMAFVWNRDGFNYDIYLREFGAETPARLTTDPAHDLHPAWSPDGRRLAFLRISPNRKEIWIKDLSAGSPSETRLLGIHPAGTTWTREASAISRIPGPAWSPDGMAIAVSDRTGEPGPAAIFLVPVGGNGAARQVSFPGADTLGDFSPVFSPSGRLLAFLRYAGARDVCDVYVQPRQGPARRLTYGNQPITGLTWLSENRLAYSSNGRGRGTIWGLSLGYGYPSILATTGKMVRDIGPAGGGRIVCTESTSNTNIWRVALDRENPEPQRLVSSAGDSHSPEYSPDGQRIAFVSNRLGPEELWIARADGSDVHQLTFTGEASPPGRPRWSPDGAKIAYESSLNGHSVIDVLPSAGGTPRIVTDPAFESMLPVWSRDGRWIYFASLRGGKRQIFRSASAGGKAIQVAGEDREETRDSVADATLHYGDPDSAGSGAWHHPTDGKPDELVTALRTAHESRYWTVTRSGLYFLDGTEPPWTIRFLSFSTRATTPVIRMARPPAFGSFGLSVSPDGKWLLYTQVDQRSSDIVSVSVPQ